jgi:hypothetical protein
MTYKLPEPEDYNGTSYTADQMQTAYQAGAATLYPLPDTLYPNSKDWLAGNYAARVEWLHTGYESKKAEIESLLQQVEMAHQAGRDAMPVCLWKKGWDCWETTCGNAFEISDGTPSENNMKYCCYCGGKVEEDIK